MPDKNQKEPLFQITHGLSKFVIILPLAIIAVALFFKAEQMVSVLGNKVAHPPVAIISQPVAQPTTEPTVPTSPTPTPIKFNLDGPFSCDYSEGKDSIKAYVKNKKIAVQTVKEHKENVVLNGDCVYKWEPNQFKGEKQCGISQLFSVFDMLASFNGGGLDAKTIISMIHSSDQNTSDFSDDFIQKAAASCKKQAVSDSVFVVPSSIQFKEVQNTDATASGSAGFDFFGAH